VILNFGKYKGRFISEIAEKDPGYLLWMLKSGAAKKTRKTRILIEKAVLEIFNPARHRINNIGTEIKEIEKDISQRKAHQKYRKESHRCDSPIGEMISAIRLTQETALEFKEWNLSYNKRILDLQMKVSDLKNERKTRLSAQAEFDWIENLDLTKESSQ